MSATKEAESDAEAATKTTTTTKRHKKKVQSVARESATVLVRTRHFASDHNAASGATTRLGVFLSYDVDAAAYTLQIPRKWGPKEHFPSDVEKKWEYGFKYALFGGTNYSDFKFEGDHMDPFNIEGRHEEFGKNTDAQLVEKMIADENINLGQEAVYERMGHAIKKDILEGKVALFFAYGLSGSGKTYTAFGPDSEKRSNAWFKQGSVTSPGASEWGIFPRLVWDLFQVKEGAVPETPLSRMQLSMICMQQMPDEVVCLISGKSGNPRTDARPRAKSADDPFQAVSYCKEMILSDFHEFELAFVGAQKHKKVMATVNNPESTRGHIVVVFKVKIEGERDEDGVPGRMKVGRFYLCDLAGAEKPTELVEYVYSSDGTKSKKKGRGQDRINKNLLRQAITINKSLGELKRIFRHFKKLTTQNKKLTVPPGIDTWLCKYLKHAFTSSKLYVFCAIRPELGFSPEPDPENKVENAQFFAPTVQTLQFGEAAATLSTTAARLVDAEAEAQRLRAIAAAAAEKKRLEEARLERERLLKLFEEAQARGDNTANALSEAEEKIAKAEAAAKAAAEEYKSKMEAERQKSIDAAAAREQAKKSKEAARRASLAIKLQGRGITFGPAPQGGGDAPYIVMIESSSFESRRWHVSLKKGGPTVTFGYKGGDTGKPFEKYVCTYEIDVHEDHCAFKATKAGVVTLEAREGITLINGTLLRPDDGEATLEPNDRVCLNGANFIVVFPGQLDAPFREIGDADDPLPNTMPKFVEISEWLPSESVGHDTVDIDGKLCERGGAAAKRATYASAEGERLWDKLFHHLRVQRQDVKKLIATAKSLCVALGRTQIDFERGHSNTSQRSDNYIEGAHAAESEEAAEAADKSKSALGFTFVTVTNLATQQSVSLSINDLDEAVIELKETLSNVNTAIDDGESYSVPSDCDPEVLFFKRPVCIGVGTVSWKSIALGIETTGEEATIALKSPYGVPQNAYKKAVDAGLRRGSAIARVVQEEATACVLHHRWFHADDAARDAAKANPVTTPDALLGMAWKLHHEVKSISGLPYAVEKCWVEYEWDGQSYEDPSMLYERSGADNATTNADGTVSLSVTFPTEVITSHATTKCDEDMVAWLKRMAEYDVAVKVMVIPHVDELDDTIQVKSGAKVALLPPLPPPRQLKNQLAAVKEELEAANKAHTAALALQAEKAATQVRKEVKRAAS